MNDKNCIIGIDQHKYFSQIKVMDTYGKHIDQCRLEHSDREAMKAYFSQFPQGTSAAIEATGFTYWLTDLLMETGIDVHMAHPFKVKLIAEAKVKTDKIDARVLAELLRTNFFPEAYIPNPDLRQKRQLLRYRSMLVRMQTSLKNRIHALLDRHGIQKPKTFESLFCKQGREFLSDLDLPRVDRMVCDNWLEILDECKVRIKDAEKHIRRICKDDPRAELLMTVPGIGYITAYTLLSEIGTISRFASAKKLCSYAGLVPRVSQSASHMYSGHITKQGNSFIRFCMVEAAHTASRTDYRLAQWHNKLKRNKGGSIAAVALARKMLTMVWHLLSKHIDYKTFCQRSSGYARRINWSQ
jgi:transposase